MLRATLDFVMNHAGAVYGNDERRAYSDGFRRFVIDLSAPGLPGASFTTADLAEATGVPLGTIKDWLKMPDTQMAPAPGARSAHTVHFDHDPEPAPEPSQEPMPPADSPAEPPSKPSAAPCAPNTASPTAIPSSAPSWARHASGPANRAAPVRRALLTLGLAELDILDPDHRLACDLAYYGRDAITRGLATFAAKRDRGILPSDLDDPGPYLAGIIRNLDERFELESLADRLLEQRIRLKDFCLATLTAYADGIRAALPRSDQPQAFIDRALKAEYAIDFRFGKGAAADALEALPPASCAALYPTLAKHVAYR